MNHDGSDVSLLDVSSLPFLFKRNLKSLTYQASECEGS